MSSNPSDIVAPETSGQKSDQTPASGVKNNDNIVQYILVRTDLKWNLGAEIAQACHASVAAIVSTLQDNPTKDYLHDLENMHKVVLRADSLEELKNCEQKLKEAKIAHHLWIERPEEVASCLAVSPQPRSLVQSFFKHLKLLK